MRSRRSRDTPARAPSSLGCNWSAALRGTPERVHVIPWAGVGGGETGILQRYASPSPPTTPMVPTDDRMTVRRASPPIHGEHASDMLPQRRFTDGGRTGHRPGAVAGPRWHRGVCIQPYVRTPSRFGAPNRRTPTFFPWRSWCRAPPRSTRCSTGPPPTPKSRYFGAHSRKSAHSRPPNSRPIPRATWGSRRRTCPCKSPSTPRGPPFMPRSARSAAVGDAQITELAKVAELPNGLVTESGKRGPFTRRGPPDAR